MSDGNSRRRRRLEEEDSKQDSCPGDVQDPFQNSHFPALSNFSLQCFSLHYKFMHNKFAYQMQKKCTRLSHFTDLVVILQIFQKGRACNITPDEKHCCSGFVENALEVPMQPKWTTFQNLSKYNSLYAYRMLMNVLHLGNIWSKSWSYSIAVHGGLGMPGDPEPI